MTDLLEVHQPSNSLKAPAEQERDEEMQNLKALAWLKLYGEHYQPCHDEQMQDASQPSCFALYQSPD